MNDASLSGTQLKKHLLEEFPSMIDPERTMEQPFQFHLYLQKELNERQETLPGLALCLKVAERHLEEVFSGKCPLSADLAVKLAHHWQVSAGLLLSVQRDQEETSSEAPL